MNRDKDLIATTDGLFGYTHKDPERVYKLSRVKVCAPKTQPYKSRNNMSHILYNHPYALNHIQLVSKMNIRVK